MKNKTKAYLVLAILVTLIGISISAKLPNAVLFNDPILQGAFSKIVKILVFLCLFALANASWAVFLCNFKMEKMKKELDAEKEEYK